MQRIWEVTRRWAELTLLVVGDRCRDIWVPAARRESDETYTLTIEPKLSSFSSGMAGLVTVNVDSLGGRSVLACGPKEPTRTRLVIKTPEGERCVGRLDENPDPVNDLDEERHLMNRVKQIIAGGGCQGVIVADHGYGTCTPSVLATTIHTAKMKGIPVLVDPSLRTQWEHYEGCTAIKPNHAEYMSGSRLWLASIRPPERPIVVHTEGQRGATVIMPDEEPVHTGAIFVENPEPLGCGDVVAAAIGLSLAAGVRDPKLLADIAVIAGAAGAAQKRTPRVTLGHFMAFAELLTKERERVGEPQPSGTLPQNSGSAPESPSRVS